MVEQKMQLVDWLDDLSVRFIINLPNEELGSIERICFQIEEAQWFYEDFVRPLDPSLPSLNLRQFILSLFQHCPLFAGYSTEKFVDAYTAFLTYKTRVPVRGAILLNDAMDECVLVKGWKKSASWSFPRGKINKDEKDIDCAIREVYEETGYDIKAAGLAEDESEIRSIEITMREQHMMLFVFPGVPMDTYFAPRTRKEISKIQWYKLTDLPALRNTRHNQNQNDDQELSRHASKFYMVAPFMGQLKKHIAQLRKQRSRRTKQVPQSIMPEVQTQIEPSQPLQLPAGDLTMDRLMSQLRQSQQASRENNFPEVTMAEKTNQDFSMQLKSLINVSSEPPVQAQSAQDGSAQLRSLLNISTITSGQQESTQDDAAVRENKAQAMLSLLRGPAPRKDSFELPPETPFDQITANPLQPPPSPKQHPHRVSRAPIYPAPPAFPFSPPAPPPTSNQPRPPYVSQPQIPGPLLRPEQSSQRPPQPAHVATQLPPEWNQSSSNGLDAPFVSGDRQHAAAPSADSLPIPKLSAHSSKLLDLFKQAPSSPRIAQLPADSPRPELSASRPISGSQPQFPFGRSGVADTVRPSFASAHNTTGTSLRSGQRTPSQQETLLNLFKNSAFPGKPSSSLASPLAPVELSANPDSARIDTNFYAQIPQSPREARALVRNISPLTEDERPYKLPLNGGVELSPDLSATVTGPLSEMHFENLKSPDQKRRTKLQQSPKHLSPKDPPRSNANNIPQQQIRILARPSSGHVATPVSPKAQDAPSPRPRKSREMKEKLVSKPVFQPQILKRPVNIAPVPEDLPAPVPKAFPQQILSRSANLDNIKAPGTSSGSDTQRAQLLALFGAKKADTPPVMSAFALPVSPLSERPPPESALPSPLGVNSRSRLGSLQSMTGIGENTMFPGLDSLAGSGKSTPKPGVYGALPAMPPTSTPRSGSTAVASPVDRNFLLGFLDGVAKEGAR